VALAVIAAGLSEVATVSAHVDPRVGTVASPCTRIWCLQ
jgi:hypothetical protein